MATGSFVTQNYSRSQSEVPRDLHIVIMVIDMAMTHHGHRHRHGHSLAPLNTHRVEGLIHVLSAVAQSPFSWHNMEVQREGASSGVILFTCLGVKVKRFFANSLRIAL
ncbi:hypothetical protein TNCV_1405261 [Trichonephila clavipes]|nr:hypothetical protein TNCV_1405261 [Trichonephila clavipes]